MELPLTPSARPRRAPRRSSGAPGAGERRRFFTGRRRLRDASLRVLQDQPEPPYGTSLLTGRRRWDEPPYGPGPLRDEPPCAEALTDELPYTNGTSPSRAGGAYGTSPYKDAYGTSVLTGRRRLRDEPLYRPELRASIRDGPLPRDPGGLRRRYGTSLLAGPTAFTGRPITGRNCFLTYGPEALTGRATGRRCWDEPRYGTDAEALARLASLHNGGTDGTSLLTGRRRLRDEPVYGTEGPDEPELPTSLWDAPFTAGGLWDERVRGAQGRLLTGRRRLRDEPPGGPEAEAYGTSLFTGRRRWDEPPYGPER